MGGPVLDTANELLGDVNGPSSSIDNQIARFNAESGKLIQTSLPTIDDSGNIEMATSQEVRFRDPQLSINSPSDTFLDIKADGAVRILPSGAATNGHLAIGATAVPEGGIGNAVLALDGSGANNNAPIVQFTVATDGDYPIMTIAPLGQSSGMLAWSAYYDTGWKSSVTGAVAWSMEDAAGTDWEFNGAIANQGTAITWTTVFSVDSSFEMTYSPAAARRMFFRDGAIHAASLDDGHFDVTADVSVDIHSPLLNAAAVTLTGNITVPEDGTIGITGPAERFVFDGTAGNIHVLGADFGIGTSTVPHGAIGFAMLALDGANQSASGPHVQFTTATDDFPLMQLLMWSHDDVAILWDASFDGGFRSADAGSNFSIRKNADLLAFAAETGIAAGNVATFVTAFQIEPDAEVLYSPAAARKWYFRDDAISISSGTDSILQLEADGYVRVGTGTTDAPASLGANGDFLVSGKLEVNGRSYCDSLLTIDDSVTPGFTLYYVGSLRGAFIAHKTYNQWLLGTSGAIGEQLILGEVAYYLQDFDHANQTNPTFYGHDVRAPNVSNNMWWSLTHDQTGMLISTGANTGAGSAPVTIDNYIKFAPRGTDAMIILGDGNVGIATMTVPHGGVGAAKLALDGPGNNVLGPHIQVTVATDDQPLVQFFNWAHDAVGITLDGYFDGAWRSADAGSNFRIYKNSDLLAFGAEAGVAQGAAATFVTAFQIEADAEVLFSPGAARPLYFRDAAISAASLTDGHLNLTADIAVDINSPSLNFENFAEARWYDDGGNYVGFEAPALVADQIWTLPPADGDAGGVLTTDGSGALSWTDNASEKTWAFMSRDAGSGTNYIGGFYAFGATDNDFNPTINWGTANASYAAHFFVVAAAGGAGGTDTVIRITGTSITDGGVRTTSDTQDLTLDDAGAAGAYYETTKKWLGQIAIVVLSGPDLLCNYGWCKYWDNNNTAFKVSGVEATWLGAANDATPDILLHHHKATGWTYNAGSTPTPPAAIASMAADHNTEIRIRNNEEGAWKRDNLSTNIDGGDGEGTIIELVTTSARTYAIGNFLVRIVPQ